MEKKLRENVKKLRKRLDETQNQRLVEVLKKLIGTGVVRNWSSLSRDLRKDKSYFTDLIRRNGQIPSQIVEKLLVRYPEINLDYVLNGTGEPIIEQVTPSEQLPTADEPAIRINSTSDADMPDHTNHLVTKENMERMQRELNELREQFAVLRYRLEVMEKEK